MAARAYGCRSVEVEKIAWVGIVGGASREGGEEEEQEDERTMKHERELYGGCIAKEAAGGVN
jgi:hypothetical protein